MEFFWQVIITITCSVLASQGLWAFIQSKDRKQDAKTRLLVGLAHDRIMALGSMYIERGYITIDEYENLNNYLFEPYTENRGNGSAAKMMADVRKLPLHSPTIP